MTYSGAPWILYDPETSVSGTDSAGSWEDLSTDTAIPSVTGDPGEGGPYQRVYTGNAIQLLRTPCGNLCGKFLVVGQGCETGGCFADPSNPDNTPADPEIWDPAAADPAAAAAWRKLGLETGYQEGSPNNGLFGGPPTLTLLPNGQVLMRTANFTGGFTAQLFDPVTERFTTITDAPVDPNGTGFTLPDGSVFFPSSVLLYRPDTSTPWEVLPITARTPRAQLADGRILATSGTGVSMTYWMFDPVSKVWGSTALAAPGVALTFLGRMADTRPGSCGNLCERVLFRLTTLPSGSGTPTRFYKP